MKSLRIGYGRENRKGGTGRSPGRVTEEVPLSVILFPIRETHTPWRKENAAAATSLENS